MGDAQSSLGFVEGRQQIVVSPFGVTAWEIVLDERGDTLAVAIDCIDDHSELGGNGGQIDGRHPRTLG